MQIKENTRLGPDTHLQRKISLLYPNIGLPSPLGPFLIMTNLNTTQILFFYREVAMADLPSQYAEEVETFRHVLNLPDPRETMPRSSTSSGSRQSKGQQELRPRGPSSMLSLSSHIKDAFIYSNSNWTFIALNLPKQEDSKAQQSKKQSTKFCVQGHNRGRTPRRTPGG